jgi:TetR/AcrR family tetracycline transcriptional repressor
MYANLLACRQMVKRGTAAGPRAPWGSLSREQIVTAATQLVRDSGYENLTIRRLASRLGVAPMSVYRHVRDKDDLLDEVVDKLLVRAWRPRVPESDWRTWVTEAANKLRQFLVSQPAALHVFLSHPVVTANAMVRMEAVMSVLRGGLGDDAAARRAYAAVHTYTIGFAALEAARSAPRAGANSGVTELSRQLAGLTTAAQFAEGLGYLLAGIEQVANAGVGRSPTTRSPPQGR